MPRRADQKLPTMLLHRHSGRARVRLNGLDVYLGEWGSAEADEEYDRVIGLWLDNGRRWPPPVQHVPDVAELCDRFAAHAQDYYRKAGRPTTTVHNITTAIELLYRAGLAHEEPRLFGPLKLKEFQRYLANDPHSRWARPTINRYVGVIVQMFRWAASEQLIEESTWRALESVAPLRKGRAVAGGRVPREGRRVRAVPPAKVEATLPHLPPVVAAMVRLQLLTGMRPGEVVALRPRDLAVSADERVWVYTVAEGVYKLDHLDEDADDRGRLRYLGPRCVELLKTWIGDDADAPIFSPKASEKLRNAARRAARETPAWPSHNPEERRVRRGLARRRYGDAYSVASYRRAIERACDRAFPPPAAMLPAEGIQPTPQQAEALELWRREHRWHPNQLRHARATLIANSEKLHDAASALGHSQISTTMRYVTLEDPRAVDVALRHG